MKLEGDFLFDAPIEEVWTALLDPVVLAAAMPGCEKLERVDGCYEGELNIKVGPVQGKFSGKVDLKDMQEPRSYTMIVEGRGAPGFVKATAAVRLERDGEGTRLRYDADAQVGGKIASVGQRLLEASARAISRQSLEGLQENIRIRSAAKAATSAPAAAKAAASTPTAAQAAPAERAAAPAPEAPGAPDEAAAPDRAAPPPALRPIDQTQLAVRIAKEVTRAVLPRPVVVTVAVALVALVGWLVARR
ncbi:MAG TPA: carbon monoxide dehydrogenase subunit G [Polyangiaceae bacterium]|nr:carbon monoxide dehydrogenase subunit G [Polyangiaceae bacterium]